MSHRMFAFATAACAGSVWSALTCADQTARYLFGLQAHSTWRADTPVRFETVDGHSLTGRVLHVAEPHRLSYVLQSAPDDPAVYLTWQIRPIANGTVVRLLVDEIGSVDEEDVEDTWLPILAALQALLAKADEPL